MNNLSRVGCKWLTPHRSIISGENRLVFFAQCRNAAIVRVANYSTNSISIFRNVHRHTTLCKRHMANITNRSHDTPPMPPDQKRTAIRSAIIATMLSCWMAWAILREPDEEDKIDYKAMEDNFRKRQQQINTGDTTHK
jgi:hypothetical protein